MKIETDRLITPATFARKKDISRQAVYKQIDAGKLPTIRIDGVVFIISKQPPQKASVPG